jgi:pimeloyl-ACP methyl ester carboxylesterase
LGATAFLAGCVVLYEARVLLQLSARPDPDADREFRFPGERTHFIATSDGGELYAEECGAGRPILLLHGHGASMRTFSLMAAPLAAGGCRVIAMDQRGFGRSSSVPPMFGFPGLVDDAATVLEHLDLRDAIVVGHSMGGGVALGLAIDRPEIVAARVAAIVLINSSGRGPADRPLTRAKVTALDWQFLERLGRNPRHGLVLARANFGPEPRRSHVDAVRAIGTDSPVEPRRGFARRLLGIDLTRALSRVQVPVLLLAGAADAVVPVQESDGTARLIPSARIETFANAGHMLPLECSEEVAQRILTLAAEAGERSG